MTTPRNTPDVPAPRPASRSSPPTYEQRGGGSFTAGGGIPYDHIAQTLVSLGGVTGATKIAVELIRRNTTITVAQIEAGPGPRERASGTGQIDARGDLRGSGHREGRHRA